MKSEILSILLLQALLPVVCLPAVAALDHGGTCPMKKMQVERLPDLHEPRTGHVVLLVDGDPMVFGGHTSGFVPSATAERYSNGEWHLQPMTYSHDEPVVLPMESGKIVIAGGHEQPLGIGQTFTLELYHQAQQSFEGYGCLDVKRCFAQGMEIDSGRVVISGNWYHNDNIECFDGSRQCLKVKDVTQHRSLPYILRTAKDNAIIFSSHDNHGLPLDTIVIDRLHGEPFTEPLLQTWRPYYNHTGNRTQDAFIGDTSRGEYTYLIPGIRSDGEMALLKVEGEHFSLLPTACPVPTRSQWGTISYFSSVVADRRQRRAYMSGYGIDDGDHRLYVLSIDYGVKPADLTLYYSEPQRDSIGCYCPVLTADGNLLIAGGIDWAHFNNFKPFATTLLLRVGSPVAAETLPMPWWLLALAALVVLALVAVLLMRKRRLTGVETTDVTPIERTDYEQLMQPICRLMDERQLFLNSGLTVADVAAQLGVHRNAVSQCINAQTGCSFAQFVARYRVEYAQQMLRRQPDKKLSAVWRESGFASETSFFRTFKALTGMTPSEWVRQG